MCREGGWTYLNDDRMRLIANPKDIISGDEPEPSVCALEVIECLTQITFGREQECRETFVAIFYLLIKQNNKQRE